ncbi:MAG: Serine/threonine-protein kinase PrkC [Chloroflexi bacterium]|nr:Serine/threonine-protein kinase PrkC [Chloroflexota bacterium]
MVRPSLVGQNLGKYRVLEPLGRGGMARVYQAYHPKLDRYVAIKVLRSDLEEDEKFLARFQQEAQSVAKLRHPNIIQVFDFDIEDNLYYMVMELLAGDTLKTRLNDYRVQNQKMPLGETTRVMLDVLRGLAYAHKSGVIHRDIKPANILLTQRGEAILSDFGIAHIIGTTQHTASSTLMGTLNYMAPEQGLEGKSDARSDIYALGITLYEMLAQRPPFEGETPLAILMKHINNPLPPPKEINPDIPTVFQEIVLKALEKTPENRYSSSKEMALALGNATEKINLELPTHISLPLSFTTEEMPSESVIVLSGSAREKLTEAKFADQDTDPKLDHPSETKTFKEKSIPERIMGISWREERSSSRADTILRSIGVFLIVNSLAIIMAGLTEWEIFNAIWPIEFFLIAHILSGIMTSTRSIWFMIPVGIITGNGLLFLYATATGLWGHWSFLWVFEVLLLFGILWWTIKVGNQEERGPYLAQSLGRVLVIALAALSFGTLAMEVLFYLRSGGG